jgi:long-chain acyl-CoA synthetase
VHRAFGLKFWALISGGGALPAPVEQFWNALGFVVVQGYGMTETTALITLNHPFHVARGTIGKPLPGREVKIGPDGEVLVRGPMISTSTWSGGELRQREDEWLSTGDLAETQPTGELRFLGRKSEVIVTGAGVNIHPEDLEAVIEEQPGVAACAVVPIETPSGPEPCAVIAMRGPAEQAPSAIEAANSRLAEFQRVLRWKLWPEPDLPRTSTGKVRRKAVALWLAETQVSRNGSQPAHATASDWLLSMVVEITGETPPGSGDELRLAEDLHLDSLGRVQLAAAIEEKLGMPPESGFLEQVQTLGQLRRLLASGAALTSAFSPHESTGSAQGTGSSPYEDPAPASGTLQAAGKLAAEGGGGFNPRIKPGESTWALAPDESLPPISPETVSSSATSLAPDVSHSHSGGAPIPFDSGSALHGNGAPPLPPIGTGASPRQTGRGYIYPHWPWSAPVRLARSAFIEMIMRPLVRLLAKPRIFVPTDLTVREPILIVANHVSTYDGPLVQYALPGRMRRRIAAAMSGEMLDDFRHFRNPERGPGDRGFYPFGPIAYFLLTALFNVFPLPRLRDFQRSFAHAGEALDRGYHVLVFPEGTRSAAGQLARFRPGIGLLVKQSDTPVLPVAIRGLGELKVRGRGWFRSGTIEVHVGQPIRFAPDATETAITGRLHQEVEKLLNE